jgi:hypothetical protein
MCPWNSIVWLQWNCCCEQNINAANPRLLLSRPHTNKRSSQHNPNFTQNIKKAKARKPSNYLKESKKQKTYLKEPEHHRRAQQSLPGILIPENGEHMPHPPRRPIPRTLHPPTRHRLANPPIPALAPRAPAPPRSSPDSLPRKCRGPASHADPAGRTPCERDWSPRGVLARPEGASGCAGEV